MFLSDGCRYCVLLHEVIQRLVLAEACQLRANILSAPSATRDEHEATVVVLCFCWTKSRSNETCARASVGRPAFSVPTLSTFSLQPRCTFIFRRSTTFLNQSYTLHRHFQTMPWHLHPNLPYRKTHSSANSPTLPGNRPRKYRIQQCCSSLLR
jgi:hypothetical protein